MGDADIFDAQASVREQGDNVRQRSGPVGNLHIGAEGALDGTAGSIDKRITIDAGTVKLPKESVLVVTVQLLFKVCQGMDVIRKECRNVCGVCQADLLPHQGGGGGDAGYVFEASCRNHLHQPVLIIAVSHKVYQGSGDYMGQMADGGDNIVMLFVIQYQGDRTHACHKVSVGVCFFCRDAGSRGFM